MTAPPRLVPFVSVVVPTRNRCELLRECLQSLLAQDYPHDAYEVIVVDDRSSDKTPEVVSSFRRSHGGNRVRYVLSRGRGGLNAARNIGLGAAKGDPICFVDDDVVVPPSWLTEMVRAAAANPHVGCLGGPIRLRLEGRAPRLCRRAEPLGTALDLGPRDRFVGPNRCDIDAGTPGDGPFGANMAVRRWSIALVGAFDERLSGPGDETEWQWRLYRHGGQLLYVSRAPVWHRRTVADLTLRVLLRRKFEAGRRHIAYLEIVGTPFSPGRELVHAALAVTHAVRRRCSFGLLAASLHLGRLWGWTSRRTVGAMDGCDAFSEPQGIEGLDHTALDLRQLLECRVPVRDGKAGALGGGPLPTDTARSRSYSEDGPE